MWSGFSEVEKCITSGNLKFPIIIKIKLCSQQKWKHMPWAMLSASDRAQLEYDYGLKGVWQPLGGGKCMSNWWS